MEQLDINKLIKSGENNGRINFIMGRPGTGKSTILLKVINEYQKLNENVLFISLETSKDMIESNYKKMFDTNLNSNVKILDSLMDIDEVENILLKDNIKVVLIDYYQLFRSNKNNTLDKILNLKNKNINFVIASQISDEYIIEDQIKNISDYIYIIK